MTEKHEKTRNPWLFIPTQYFAEGIPFVIVNQLSVALFKSLQASNVFIGFTSFLYIPWSVKFLWSPFLEAKSTKRNWVLATQFILAVFFGLIALFIQFSLLNSLFSIFSILLVFFTLIAFVSATHDVATDGFYLYALKKEDQALFTGIRSTFYRFAMIFAGGILVTLAGTLGISYGSVRFGWTIAFLTASILFFLMFFYHKAILPYPEGEKADRAGLENRIPFKEVFRQYFSQEKLGVVLAFILLYRFGEGLLLKMAQPFLMDKVDVGGMGISLSEVGIIYGTFGVIAMVIGGILGGWLIKKYSLRKLIWPLALSIHLPNILYIYLAAAKPQVIWKWDFSFIPQIFGIAANWAINVHPLVQSCIMVEQFGYGLGFSSFTVYLLYISKGRYKTSFYAISTGLMAIGMMVPGFLSGIMQVHFGYLGLFIISTILCVPGMITIFFLPFGEND